MMREVDAAWLAGLLEGEGSFIVGSTVSSNGYTSYRTRISLAMTDKDVVDRAAVLMGAVVRQQPATGMGSKDIFYTHLERKADVSRVITKILPWLGERRLATAEHALMVNTDLRTGRGGKAMPRNWKGR